MKSPKQTTKLNQFLPAYFVVVFGLGGGRRRIASTGPRDSPGTNICRAVVGFIPAERMPQTFEHFQLIWGTPTKCDARNQPLSFTPYREYVKRKCHSFKKKILPQRQDLLRYGGVSNKEKYSSYMSLLRYMLNLFPVLFHKVSRL